MTPQEFVAKWQTADLSERGGYQMHFNDLCALFGFPKPGDLGANDAEYCFEKRAARVGKSAKGWADVWKRDAFAWEYKGAHKDLEAAYDQLLRYHDDLGSPPVLVVCDLHTIVVRIKRTNRALVKRIIPLESLEAFQSPNLAFLRRCFTDPQGIESGESVELITQSVASTLGEVADSLQKRYNGQDERVARFLDRIVFGFFAEDAGLLPKGVLGRIFTLGATDAARVSRQLGALFEAMRDGGDFGVEPIRHFNGNLFDAPDLPLDLTAPECHILLLASRKNWAEIDPSIFGTLFERSLDTRKRAQLGAHYTSRADIETLVKPVILEPLFAEWEAVRSALEAASETPRLEEGVSPANASIKAGLTPSSNLEYLAPNPSQQAILDAWLARLEGIRVLDPACGSGAFLYVALEGLLDLEKRARVWAEDAWGTPIEGRIRPEHLLGLELNAYAHDLAQITVWIGFLQWQRANGYPFPADPILRHTDNIQQGDALLDDARGLDVASERAWPPAEFIVGNPPFLGDKKMRGKLGSDYVDALGIYRDRLPGTSNFVCYWFEKARAQIELGASKRAGFVATATISQANTRAVLESINQSGAIFWARSNQPWVLDGASLRIAFIAFDNGDQKERFLNDEPVETIHSNLTAGLDLTKKEPLVANRGRSFMGATKVGDYDISSDKARELLSRPNINGRPTSDVLRPYRNGDDLTQHPSNRWIIDFGTSISENEAALYDAPFDYLVENVKAERQKNNRPLYREKWWLLAETRSGFRAATRHLARYIATSGVAEHRFFVWLDTAVLPDAKVIAFAYDDDYHFGVLQSKVHTLWAEKVGGRHGVGNTGTYNPSECFATFPFPATDAQHAAISQAALTLNERREAWLNPPEWMREEIIEFRASQDGPWGHLVTGADERGMGTARWSRLVLRPELGIGTLFKREKTLTGLYNTRPAWLASCHATLDAAVLAAYGLAADASDGEILALLLDLNASRATK